jgi:hypothetical protein
MIDGKTLSTGGKMIAPGTTYLFPSGGPIAVVSGKSYAIPTGINTVGPTTINLISPGGILIDGKTLTSGGTLIASGMTYLLPTGGTVPLVETSLPSLAALLSKPSQGPGVILDGYTLTQGGTVVVSGTTYILPTSGITPVALATASGSFSLAAGGPSQANTEGLGILIDGNTLTPGGSLVASGTTYLLLTGGTVPLIETNPPSLTISRLPQSQGSGVVLNGQTFKPGETAVISGTSFILPTDSTAPVALAIASGSFSVVPGPTNITAEGKASFGKEGNKLLAHIVLLITTDFLFWF